MMTPVTDDGWDRDALTRRRTDLTLPMVPLRTTSSPAPPRTWPDRASWQSIPSVVGTGPDGGSVAFVPSRERDDLVLAARDDGTSTVLDGALRASFVRPLPGGRRV